MKQPKRILALSTIEYRLAIHGLLQFRNKLIQQHRYPDALNELMMKLQKAILFQVSNSRYGNPIFHVLSWDDEFDYRGRYQYFELKIAF